MRLSETSREILGFDITEAPLLEEDGLENHVSEPASPVKSPSKKARLRQLSSAGSESENSRLEMYQQAQIMLELEQLTLAFDALENFQLIWDEHER